MEPGAVHCAGGAVLDELLPLACARHASAKAKLQKRMAELPAAELEPLCTALLAKLSSVMLQVLSKETPEAECLPLVAICDAAASAGTVCSPLVNAVLFLHGVLPLLDGGDLLETAHSLCASWYARKHEGWEAIWLQTFLKAVHMSLTVQSKAKIAKMRRLAIEMKDPLAANEAAWKGKLDDTEKRLLYTELAQCAVSPNYLSCLQGRKFVVFLLSLDESLADDIYSKVDGALPHMSSEQVQMLAQTYILAWKAVAEQPQALVLEKHFQDVMFWGVNGDLAESHHANLFKFLKELHMARKERSISDMLCRCYLPILWRGFKALHYKIRLSCAKIFFDSFPLVEHTQDDLQQELATHFKLMHSLLCDACPDVRVVAVDGVLRVLTDFFELIPIRERKALAKDLISQNAKDMNSIESRIKVNKGLTYMAGNPKAHTLLKTLIAKNKECLEDVYLVQVSYVSLLLAARRIPGFKFWDVVEPKELLPLMADDKQQLSLKLAELLRNSYFNPKADQQQNLERSLLLYSLNRVAFRVFYTILVDIAPLKSIVEFLTTICQVLRVNSRLLLRTSAKENVGPDNSVSCKQSGTKVIASGTPMTQFSAHVLIETMAITYSTLSIRRELTCNELKEHWKKLVALMKKTVNELFPTTESLNVQISLLTVASLLPPEEVASMSMRCFSLLRSFLTTSEDSVPKSLPMEAKACVLVLCNMRRAADILALVDESVDELKSKQTPAKRRRVHFSIEQHPCNPDLALQVLQLLLEVPHLQHRLLRDHIVPLFSTWSALSWIVDSMESWLCASDDKTLVQGTVMSAYNMFLLLTYVLHGQPHPITKEKFIATQTLECQMKWIEENLLPKLSTKPRSQRGNYQELGIQAIKIYLKVARSVLMTTWANFQFAEKFLTFLALCKETVKEDHLKTDIDLIPPVVKKFKVVFVEDKQQASVIDTLLDKISSKNL